MAVGLKQRALPLFLTKENKYLWGAAMFLTATLLYMAANRLHIFEPRLLPMSFIDDAVPFIPETVWIYISEYVFFLAIYATCRDMVNANKYLYSFLALQIASVTIFWVWPTTFPRELFPLVQDEMNAVTYYVFSSLRATDSPASCCPSLHVSSVYMSSFIFLDEQRKKFPLFFIWGTLIALSTLTTKQHYFIDVVAGLGMAVLFYWIFHRFVNYRPLNGVQAKR